MKFLYLSVCRYFVLLDTERITGEEHFVSSDIEQIVGYRYLCVSGHRTDHRTDDSIDNRTDCWIQWTNLTVSYSGQVRLVPLLCQCLFF